MHPRELASSNSLGAQRLLLVDPFQDEADLYAEFFVHCGFRVKTYNWTEEAFRAALAVPPDVVVMRIRQTNGQGDGIQLTSRLRFAIRTRDVQAVIMCRVGR